MNFSNWPIWELTALAIGVLGPLVLLLRDIWRNDFFSFIWERRSLWGAIMVELSFVALFVILLLGQSVVFKWIAELTTNQSPFFLVVLREVSTAVAIVLLVSFVVPTIYRLFRHFHD